MKNIQGKLNKVKFPYLAINGYGFFPVCNSKNTNINNDTCNYIEFIRNGQFKKKQNYLVNDQYYLMGIKNKIKAYNEPQHYKIKPGILTLQKQCFIGQNNTDIGDSSPVCKIPKKLINYHQYLLLSREQEEQKNNYNKYKIYQKFYGPNNTFIKENNYFKLANSCLKEFHPHIKKVKEVNITEKIYKLNALRRLDLEREITERAEERKENINYGLKVINFSNFAYGKNNPTTYIKFKNNLDSSGCKNCAMSNNNNYIFDATEYLNQYHDNRYDIYFNNKTAPNVQNTVKSIYSKKFHSHFTQST